MFAFVALPNRILSLSFCLQRLCGHIFNAQKNIDEINMEFAQVVFYYINFFWQFIEHFEKNILLSVFFESMNFLTITEVKIKNISHFSILLYISNKSSQWTEIRARRTICGAVNDYQTLVTIFSNARWLKMLRIFLSCIF